MKIKKYDNAWNYSSENKPDIDIWERDKGECYTTTVGVFEQMISDCRDEIQMLEKEYKEFLNEN